MGRPFEWPPAVELSYGSFDFGLSSIHVGDPPSVYALHNILEEQECDGVHERACASHGSE
jgi:hypothetical protein